MDGPTGPTATFIPLDNNNSNLTLVDLLQDLEPNTNRNQDSIQSTMVISNTSQLTNCYAKSDAISMNWLVF